MVPTIISFVVIIAWVLLFLITDASSKNTVDDVLPVVVEERMNRTPTTATTTHVTTRLRRTLRIKRQHHHLNHRNGNNDHDDEKILLESFDHNPQHTWIEMNDPVMGGKSIGSFQIENGIGNFSGIVKNVPFLQAPGFIQVRSKPTSSTLQKYPDISHCHAFEVILSSQYPNYSGYRMSFGNQHAPHGKMHAFGYKTHFTFDSNNNSTDKDNILKSFHSIILPFYNFTDYWDDATGDAIIPCDINDIKHSVYCPTVQVLQNIQTIAFWGEGYNGFVNLNIKEIYAIQCNNNHNSTNDPFISRNYMDSKTTISTSFNTEKSSSLWWSRVVEKLFFGDSVTVTTNDKTSTTTTITPRDSSQTTFLLQQQQRNMLLSTLYPHRW